MKNIELCISICKHAPCFFNEQVRNGYFIDQYEIRNWRRYQKKNSKRLQKMLLQENLNTKNKS